RCRPSCRRRMVTFMERARPEMGAFLGFHHREQRRSFTASSRAKVRRLQGRLCKGLTETYMVQRHREDRSVRQAELSLSWLRAVNFFRRCMFSTETTK